MAKKYIDTDKLKAEITKHYDEYKAKFHQNGERYYLGLIDGIEMTKRIIDSLQQEQSAVIATPFIQTKPCEGQEMSVSSEEEQPCDTCTNDKGCVTCKDGELWEGKEQPSEDLKEAADEYSRGLDYYHYTGDDPAIAFIAGAEWQKEQMLKDAVEANGVICKLSDRVWISPVDEEKFHQEVYDRFVVGQTVKIVIVPDKEEQK